VCASVRALEFERFDSGLAEDSGLLGRDTLLIAKLFYDI